MRKYLGEMEVDIDSTEYKDYTPDDWALHYIFMYGQIDGAHHKQWVLDQVTRILNGAPVVITEARWDDGHREYRYVVGTSTKYEQWVDEYEEVDETGDPTYTYDPGIAP